MLSQVQKLNLDDDWLAYNVSQSSSRLIFCSWTARETTSRMNCHVSIRTNSFGGSVTVKSPLTSGFFQKFASNHHSSFMMPAWGLLQWKMTRRNTYKLKTYQIWARLLAYQASNGLMLTSQSTIWALCVIKQHMVIWTSYMRSRNSRYCLICSEKTLKNTQKFGT